jgi:hypothetical protein
MERELTLLQSLADVLLNCRLKTSQPNPNVDVLWWIKDIIGNFVQSKNGD